MPSRQPSSMDFRTNVSVWELVVSSSLESLHPGFRNMSHVLNKVNVAPHRAESRVMDTRHVIANQRQTEHSEKSI